MNPSNSHNPEITPEINTGVPVIATPEIPVSFRNWELGVAPKPGALRPDPLAARLPAEVVRIELTTEQTAQLATAGPGAFNIVSRRSYPGDPSRWIITLAPADWDRAVAASNVLLGSHRATKIRTTAKPDMPQTHLSPPDPRWS